MTLGGLFILGGSAWGVELGQRGGRVMGKKRMLGNSLVEAHFPIGLTEARSRQQVQWETGNHH